MKTKMSFKRAALPIIATLLTAVISLTGVTYAWFSTGTVATVEEFEIGVEAADGLQIATNPTGTEAFTWGSNYKPDFSNVKLSPASTVAKVTNGKLTFYNAVLDDNTDKITNFTKVDNSDTKYYYVSFDMYFRNASTAAKSINIDNSTFTSLANTHQAIRIAFIKQDSVAASSTGIKAENFENNGSEVVIFEPEANTHSANANKDFGKYGITSTSPVAYKGIAGEDASNALYNRYTGDYYLEATARTEKEDGGVDPATNNYVYDLSTVTASNGEGMRAWTVADDYAKITNDQAINYMAEGTLVYKTDADGSSYVKVDEYDASITQYYLCKPAKTYTKTIYDPNTSKLKSVTTITNASEEMFTLDANTVTKVTVVIWVEGQDADCENSTSGYAFQSMLKFNAKNKERT